MKQYIAYNKSGKILRGGTCPACDFGLQDEFVIEGEANDITQKIEFDGFDEKGQPVNPRIVDKTPAEIEVDNPTPPEMPFEKQQVNITNEQWQGVLNRLDNLEKSM